MSNFVTFVISLIAVLLMSTSYDTMTCYLTKFLVLNVSNYVV